MLAEWFQITAIVSIAATFLAIVGGVIVVVKFLFDLKKELSDVKDELKDFKTEVRVDLVKMQARFDKYDGVNTDLEKRIAEIQQEQQQLKTQTVAISAQVAEVKEQAVASENRVNAILSHANITL